MKNIVVIHHNDRDGILSAALVYIYYESLPEQYNVEFISANYSKSMVDMIAKLDMQYIEKVWIVDYSVQSSNVDEFITLAKKYKVTWIDHHASSINFLQNDENGKTDILANLDGLRVIGMAGCALTYIYTKYLTEINDKDINSLLQSSNSYLYTIYTILKHHFSNTLDKVDPKIALGVLDTLNAPPIIIYAHRYDIFDLDDDVINFNYGECNAYPDNGMVHNQIMNNSYIDEYIENGKKVRQYIEMQDAKNVEENGFELECEFTDMSDNHIRTITIFSMNTEHFSSFAFGDKMDKYDICMPFRFNGKNFSYSMYTNKNYIDCGVLCSLMGGGGHPKAGGFTTDEILTGDRLFTLTKY